MSNNNIVIFDVDTATGEAKVATLQDKIDLQQQEWTLIRRETLAQMSEIGRGINLTIQAIRFTARLSGQALNPIFNALLSVVASTTSLVLATAAIIATSSLGVLSGVAITLSAAALSYQVGQTARLIADNEELQASLRSIEAKLDSVSTFGGSA